MNYKESAAEVLEKIGGNFVGTAAKYGSGVR